MISVVTLRNRSIVVAVAGLRVLRFTHFSTRTGAATMTATISKRPSPQ